MKKIRFFIGVSLITAVIAITVLFLAKPLVQNVAIFIYRLQANGSVTKEKAVVNRCNGKDFVCVMKNGEIVSQKQTSTDSAKLQKKYASEKEQHIQYAINVAAAVSAVRAYTHIPNLDLTPLTNSPVNITYYCSPDKKCWAVDNQTHKVVPQSNSK